MSLNGNPIGRWRPGPPLSRSDKRKISFWVAVAFVATFGYPIYRALRWVFW